MEDKELLSYKNMIEKRKITGEYKKLLIICIILLFIELVSDNYMYLNYLFHKNNYELSEGKIIDVSFHGKLSTQVLIQYSIDGNIYEGTTFSYNLGDHEGDEITIIIKGGKIGRTQFAIGLITLMIILGLIATLITYYAALKQLKEYN